MNSFWLQLGKVAHAYDEVVAVVDHCVPTEESPSEKVDAAE